MSAFISDPYLLTNGVMGYYSDPAGGKVPDDKARNVRSSINALNVDRDANDSVDLWSYSS